MLSPVRMYLVLSLLLFLAIDIPVPDARQYNLYFKDQLIGAEVADPARTDLIFASGPVMPWLPSIFPDQGEKLLQMDSQRAFDALFKGAESSLSKALILFVPLVALVLKLLFIRGKRLYYDHVIFSLHFQSFLLLLIAVSWCLSWIAPQAFLALLFSPIYLALALRRVYEQSWPWTLLKLAILLFSYLFVLGFALLATFGHIMAQI